MKRWPWVVVAAALLLACASEATTNDGDSALCDQYERHHDLTTALLAPAAFELSADELESVLDDRRALSSTMAADADGELRSLLEQSAEYGPAADELLVEAWRDDLGPFRAVGDGWTYTALEGHDELVAEDGSTIATADWLREGTQTLELLYLTCEAPDRADGPTEDLSETPPGGVVSYLVITDPRTTTGDRRALTTTGERAAADFVLPAGWSSPSFGDVDGGRIVVNAQHGNTVGLLTSDGVEPALEIAYDGGIPLVCPSLSPARRTVLASEHSFSGEDRGIFEVADADAADLGLDLPLQGCAAEIGGGRLLVAPAAADLSEPPGAAVMARDGSDFEAIDLPPHCQAVLGDVDAAQGQAALALRCGTPGDSGLWTVDLETLEATHSVSGLVGTPKFSPDGSWLTFSFAPLGTQSSETAIWIAKADGTGAHELVEHGAFPLWLADGADG